MSGIVEASLKSDKICMSNDLSHCKIDIHDAQKPTTTCVHPLFDQCNFVAKKLTNDINLEIHAVVFKVANSRGKKESECWNSHGLTYTLVHAKFQVNPAN